MHITRKMRRAGNLREVMPAKQSIHLGRKALASLAIAVVTAVPAASASAAPRLAIEPTSPAFQNGLRTSSRVAPLAFTADLGGGTSPGEVQASVGLDLRVGPAIPDVLLAAHLKNPKPLQTELLLASIPFATKASTSLKDLRANVIRVATAYLAAPTLEDNKSPNRSKLICALGTKESCSQRWPWCAIFASSIWRMAGIKAMPLMPPVSGIVAWGKQHHRWRDLNTKIDKNFQPAAGDIVAYGCDRRRTSCDHTGLVVSSSPKTLTTIEGNTSTLVKGRDGVATKIRSRATWISGYISLS